MQGQVNIAMGDCLWAGKPSQYVTSRLGQLSLSSLRGRRIEYQPIWLGLRWSTFVCVRWQVALCDPIRQVTLLSSEMGVSLRAILPLLTFKPNSYPS